MAAKTDDSLTREGAGNWRTKDGRFLVRGESGGHWYLVDEARHDAFGLELVTGPYPTVAAAREAIARARAVPPDGGTAVGPSTPAPTDASTDARGPAPAVTARRAAPARRAPAQAPSAPEAGAQPPSSTRPGRKPSTERSSIAVPAAPRVDRQPEPAPAEPREAAWLRGLPAGRRRTAEALLDELDRLGIEEPDEIVRLDMTSDRAHATPAALRRRLAAIVAEAPDAAAARATVDAVVRLLTVDGRADDRADGLPGWGLVETRADRPGRPIALDDDP